MSKGKSGEVRPGDQHSEPQINQAASGIPLEAGGVLSALHSPASAAAVYSARLLTLLVVFVLTLGVGFQLYSDYRAAMETNEQLLSAVARAAEQRLVGSLRGVDSVLNDLVEAKLQGQTEAPSFTQRMQSRIGTFREIRYVGFITADGVLMPPLWPGRAIPAQGVNVADREYFQVHQKWGKLPFVRQKIAAGEGMPTSPLVVGNPTLGRLNNERVLHLSRGIYAPNGDFLGVAVAGIDPDAYAEFLQTLMQDQDGTSAILGTNGLVVARSLDHPLRFAQNISRSDLFTVLLPQSPTGVASFVSEFDGQYRLMAYRRLNSYPLVVVAGVPVRHALQSWRQRAMVETALVMVISALLMLWASQADRRRQNMLAQQGKLEHAVVERGVLLRDAQMLADERAARMASMNEELQRLARVTAHHLQEPLRPMVSFSLLLARRFAGAEAREVALAALLTGIQQEGWALKGILSDFQKYVGVLTEPLRHERVSSLHLAKVAAERVIVLQPEHTFHLEVDFLPIVTADAALLGEVFRQVILLAVQYRFQGEKKREKALSIRLSVRQHQGKWLFIWLDDGEGYPEDVLAQFYPSEGSQAVVEATAGTDLPAGTPVSMALTVCRAIIGAHQGEFWLEKQRDGLNGLFFTLPCAHFALDTCDVLRSSLPRVSDLGREKTSRPLWKARGLASVMVALLLGCGSLQLKLEYDEAIEHASTLTATVASAIDQHVSGSLRSIDTLLEEVAASFQDDKGLDSISRDHLLSRLESYPEIRYIGTADSWGRLSKDTWPTVPNYTSGIDISDRDYYSFQLSHYQENTLRIGQPVLGRASSDRTVHVSRPLVQKDGRFVGIVFAAIDPDYYADFLEVLLLDKEGASAVIRNDGLMLARAPAHAEKFGISIANSDLFKVWLPHSDIDIAHLQAKADNNMKYLAYRRLPDYGVVVTSGISQRVALLRWNKMVKVEAAVLASFSLIALFWAWRADRYAFRLLQQKVGLEQIIQERTLHAQEARDLASRRAAHLEVVNRELQRLTAVMVQHLHQPVARVLSLTQELDQAFVERDADGERAFGFVQSAAIHLNALMRDFQRYVSVLTQTLDLKPVQMEGLARLAVEDLGRTLAVPPELFQWEPLPTVMGDPSLLYDVLSHLLSNAVTHFDRGYLELRVRIVAERTAPGWWKVTISDNGPGIPAALMDRVLRVFENAHTREANSTGLGLPLCRVIAQAHGGRLWINSVPEGTSISFTLPSLPDEG